MFPDLQDLKIGNWTLKAREVDKPSRVIFLVHGWTGDENSMWVFANRMPKEALLIAPRAPYVSKHPELAGYSWVEQRGESFSSLDLFGPAVSAFSELINELTDWYPSADFSSFAMVGFSQGGAFSAAFAMRRADRVSRLAMLASFLPEESSEALPALAGKPMFIAHGTRDETVPIERAQAARQQLAAAGASVRYCESEIGHKLGANCAAELVTFFSE
jgi:phospholipase/carboxylesterase